MNPEPIIVETCIDQYPMDMLERPVRVIASGLDAVVVDARGDFNYGFLTVQTSPDSEPVELRSSDCQPLCVHCQEPLYLSQWMAPGTCLNEDCFLYAPGEIGDASSTEPWSRWNGEHQLHA